MIGCVGPPKPKTLKRIVDTAFLVDAGAGALPLSAVSKTKQGGFERDIEQGASKIFISVLGPDGCLRKKCSC